MKPKTVPKTSSTQLLKKFRLIHSQTHDKQKDYHYAIEVNGKADSGNFGEVRRAYPYDPNTQQANESKPFAVKIFKKLSDFSKKEARIFNRIHGVENIVENEKEVLLFMKYISGEKILREVYDQSGSNHKELNEAIKKLSFQQRINLIFNIALSLNVIHHEKPSTGKAIIHADLKGANILFEYVNGAFNVSIVDFGLSQEIDHDDPHKKHPSELRGSSEYSPKEVFNELRGLKSDIYSLVPLFAYILGANNPFSEKDKVQSEEDSNFHEYAAAKYIFDGMFESMQMPNYPINIKFYVKTFLDRMQDSDYHKRPDSDEILRFFTALNNFCIAYDINSKDDDTLVIYAAKMALLASNLWNHKLDSQKIECISHKQARNSKNENIETNLTFEHYDFDENINFCKQIVQKSQEKLLDDDVLSSLMKKPIIKNDPKKFLSSSLSSSSSSSSTGENEECKTEEKQESNPGKKTFVMSGYLS